MAVLNPSPSDWTQCLLTKGSLLKIAYIPKLYAIPFCTLPDGWFVAETWHSLPYHRVKDISHNAKQIWRPSAKYTDKGHK